LQLSLQLSLQLILQLPSSPFSSLRKKGGVFVGRSFSRDINFTVSIGALAPEGLEKSFSAAF
jgi:hypothetical protein